MADTLFTQLPTAVALTGSEVVPVDQPNANPPGTFTTKRTTTAAIAQLSASASILVNQQTGTSYQFVAEDRAKLVSFSNAAPITGTLPATGPSPSNATIAWFAQVENRGVGDLTLVPNGASTIDGASSLVLVQNQGVVLAVGDDYNWYTQRGTGLTSATAVTSVGLALPSSVFNVTVSPITTTGTLTAVFQTQAANSIWAGPTTGAAATPTFRSMVTADLPDFGTAGTYGNAGTIPVVTTDAKGRVTATTVAVTPGSIGSVAASSLVGNATGSPAAATSISIGATFAFSGTTLQTTAGTGDVTWAANTYATTISANAVTFGKFQQVAGLSVVGNATNSTADVTAIAAGTDGQVLRRSGTTLGFGALSLSTAAAVTGTLPATNGGTGLASYVVGDVLYADSTTSLARLADVATGNALISGGVGVAPSWGKIGLTTHVSGTLGVANGGTGVASATAYAVLCGGTTSTGAFQSVASVGTAGQVLTSNGAGALPTWQSTAGAPKGVLTNCGLAASVAAGALTITLTDAAGSTPTASSAVSVPFRSATANDGTITQSSVTASNSLVISSGSTMGATSTTPFRLWIALFNDGGTLRLSAINAWLASTLAIFPLRQFGIASSTAEGGAGAADNAGVFYTGTAATSKAYAVLGYLEWASGLTTAGTWDTGPTRIEVFQPSSPLPGDVIQATSLNVGAGSTTTSTSLVDVTGANVSLSLTSAVNAVDVYAELAATAAAGGAGTNTLHLSTLLRGATDLGTTKIVGIVSGAGTNTQTQGAAVHRYRDRPNTTASTTYKLQHRAASTSSNTTSSNIHMTASEIMT